MADNQTYRALDIAQWILEECNNINLYIDYIRLQVLLYHCQEASMRELGRPLFKDGIEAWSDGAFVRSVAFRYMENDELDGKPYIKDSFPLMRITEEEKRLIYTEIVRYQAGSAHEYMRDIVASKPWQKANKRGSASEIYLEDMLF